MAKKTFINPFHFVPSTDPVAPTPIKDVAQTLKHKPEKSEPFVPQAPELLHDRFVADSSHSKYFSGRIVCKLTTKTPCVFGNEHVKVPGVPQLDDDGKTTTKTTTKIDNFSLDGYAAIAGTSLKGVISTIAEMASGSTMRVLNNRAFSLRSSMKQSRSAVGMIIGEKGRRKLLPLALPTFVRIGPQPNPRQPDNRPFEPTDGSDNAIWHEIISRRRLIESTATLTAVYVPKNIAAELCFHSRRSVVAIRGTCPGIAWDHTRHRPTNEQDNKVRKGSVLRPAKNGDPYEKGEPFHVEPVNPNVTQTLGIVRSLREPTVKPPKLWFSMFLPVAPRWRNSDDVFALPEQDAGILLIEAEEACLRFDAIVTESFSNAPDSPSCTALRGQTEFTRPTKRDQEPKNKGIKEGDLVFFVPLSATEVESVSISGIWREGPRWMWDKTNGTPGLLDGIDRHPMHPHREQVTLAEKMFGWVDDVSQKKDEQTQAESKVTAYKGRIRISDAISNEMLQNAQLLPNHQETRNIPDALKGYYPLKILSSPKPPCPELYMKSKPGDKAIRQTFIDSTDIQIQGWKFYVIEAKAIQEGDCGQSWITSQPNKNVEQKSWVRPIKSETEFWFHIDFENLTEIELQLLCYSLRPTDEFVHRCGFGKPLQLGAVKIEPLAIAFIDRQLRYKTNAGLLRGRKRFATLWCDQTAYLQEVSNLAAEILRKRNYSLLPSQVVSVQPPRVSDLAAGFARRIPDHHHVMMLMGKPVVLPADCIGVTYPRKGSQDGESEIFRWFVANRDTHDGALRQPPLRPLTAADTDIPNMDVF